MSREVDHVFGGQWTAEKLEVLREYLDFFSTALKGLPFKLVYIDTFAGTGKCTIRHGKDGKKTIDGSARIALDAKRPFDEYVFIEARKKHVRPLEALRASHPHGDRVTIHCGTAEELLGGVLDARNWRNSRGVLFLDPYGLQCSWRMVQRIAATRALDVLFLVSVSGLTRQAARSVARLDAGKAAALDRFLGTPDWRTALYSPPAQADIFGPQPDQRAGGPEAILQFVMGRLAGEFSHVAEPLILRNSTGAQLYALFFAVSNPSQKAVQLAARVGGDILNKLR